MTERRQARGEGTGSARIVAPPSLDAHAGTREFRVHGLETKFYGRREQLEVLYNAIRDAVNQRRLHVVPIVGPSGLGKTRLVHEFTSLIDLEARGISLMTTSSVEGESEHSPAGSAQLIRQRFAITAGLADADARELVARGLHEIVDQRRLADATQLITHLLGLRGSEGSRTDLPISPEAVHQRAVATFANLIRYDASRRPAILVFDAFQWAPWSTRELFSALVRALKDSAALLVVLSREPVDPALLAGAEVLAVTLEPLPDAVMTRILRHLLRRVHDLPDALVDRTVQRARGNPALLEDIVRLMLQREILVDAGERWELRLDKLKGARLPATQGDAAKARVEGLGPRERAVLEMASVYGPVFWFGGVLSMMRLTRDPEPEGEPPRAWVDDRNEARLNAILLEMQSQDLIEFRSDSGLAGEVAFTFLNPIEQQQVHAAIDPERRAMLHRAAAQWIAQVAPRDNLAIQEVVAWHLENGGALEAAADAWRRAAALARATLQNRRAIDLLQRAIGLYEPTQADKLCAAHEALAELHGLVGEWAAARTACLDTLWLSTVLTSRAWGGRAYLRLGEVSLQQGDAAGAMESLDRGLKLFQDVSDHAGIASCLDAIGRVHWHRGEYGSHREALACFLKSLSLRRKAGDEGAIARSLAHIGTVHLGRGQFRPAEESFREALEVRRRLGDRAGVALALIGVGDVHHACGRIGDAIEAWEEALGIATELGDREVTAFAQVRLGEAKLALGVPRDAEPLLLAAQEAATEMGDRRTLAEVLRNKAVLARVRNQWELALDLVREAVKLGEALQAKPLVGTALRTEGDILADLLKRPITPATGGALMPDADKQASECYQRSMAYFEEMGDTLGLSRSLRSYGTFLMDRGVVNKARKLLQRADEVMGEAPRA